MAWTQLGPSYSLTCLEIPASFNSSRLCVPGHFGLSCRDYNRVPMLDHLFLIRSAIVQNDIPALSILELVDAHDLMVESDMGTKSGKFEVLITKSR